MNITSEVKVQEDGEDEKALQTFEENDEDAELEARIAAFDKNSSGQSVVSNIHNIFLHVSRIDYGQIGRDQRLDNNVSCNFLLFV